MPRVGSAEVGCGFELFTVKPSAGVKPQRHLAADLGRIALCTSPWTPAPDGGACPPALPTPASTPNPTLRHLTTHTHTHALHVRRWATTTLAVCASSWPRSVSWWSCRCATRSCSRPLVSSRPRASCCTVRGGGGRGLGARGEEEGRGGVGLGPGLMWRHRWRVPVCRCAG